jgi:small subunit ribosomal protein S16
VVKIRLARGGAKKAPFYRIVVADVRSPRDGKFIERLGSYNPMVKEQRCVIDLERVEYWLSVGAKPTERVQKLIQQQAAQ